MALAPREPHRISKGSKETLMGSKGTYHKLQESRIFFEKYKQSQRKSNETTRMLTHDVNSLRITLARLLKELKIKLLNGNIQSASAFWFLASNDIAYVPGVFHAGDYRSVVAYLMHYQNTGRFVPDAFGILAHNPRIRRKNKGPKNEDYLNI